MNKLDSLISRIKRGEDKALDKLLGQVWGAIGYASHKVLFDPDWLQEVRIIVHEIVSAWDFSPDKHFESVIYQRLNKEAQRFYYQNYEKHQNKTAQAEAKTREESFAEDLDMEMDREWLKNRLKTIVKGYLSEKDARIIYLYFYKSMGQEAIGDALGMPQQTVSYRLQESLKTLKQLLEVQELYSHSKELL